MKAFMLLTFVIFFFTDYALHMNHSLDNVILL